MYLCSIFCATHLSKNSNGLCDAIWHIMYIMAYCGNHQRIGVPMHLIEALERQAVCYERKITGKRVNYLDYAIKCNWMQLMYNGTIFGGETFCKQVNN